MKNDDGIVYYKGLSSSNDDETAFNPLDDFGMPNAGCTSIEYYNPKLKIWEEL